LRDELLVDGDFAAGGEPESHAEIVRQVLAVSY
jgi:hypothetical protein